MVRCMIESFAEFPTDEIVDSSNINLLFMIMTTHIFVFIQTCFISKPLTGFDLPFRADSAQSAKAT